MPTKHDDGISDNKSVNIIPLDQLDDQPSYKLLDEVKTADDPDHLFYFYIKNYILKDGQVTIRSAPRLLAKGGLITIGTLFGVAWMNAAMASANIFPAGAVRDIFSYIFAGGTIITLGADGIWVMNAAGNMLQEEAPQIKLLYQQDNKKVWLIKTLTISICSLATSTCWVYAAMKYNPDLWSWIASILIVFPNNYAFGNTGYSTLLNNILNFISNIVNSNDIETEKIRKTLLEKVSYLINNSILIPTDITTAEQFVNYLLQLDANTQPKHPKLRIAFRLLLTITIPLLYSSVTGLLNKQFLYKEILSNNVFAYFGTTLLTSPWVVISMVSTYDVSGRLFDVFAGQKNSNSIKHKLYPTSNLAITLIMLLVAVTAPTAEMDIAYKTIHEETSSNNYALIATIGIMLFHYILFNFTASELVTNAMILYASTRTTKENVTTLSDEEESPLAENDSANKKRIADQHKRLSLFFTAVERTDSRYLKPLTEMRTSKFSNPNIEKRHSI